MLSSSWLKCLELCSWSALLLKIEDEGVDLSSGTYLIFCCEGWCELESWFFGYKLVTRCFGETLIFVSFDGVTSPEWRECLPRLLRLVGCSCGGVISSPIGLYSSETRLSNKSSSFFAAFSWADIFFGRSGCTCTDSFSLNRCSRRWRWTIVFVLICVGRNIVRKD